MKVLAIDLGASSGRAILGTYDNGIIPEEIHRFENTPQERNGHLYWDIDALFSEIKTGIKKCCDAGHNIQSISIDTWGCDFGLISFDESNFDKSNGKDGIIHTPLCYRDNLTENIMDEVFKIIPKEELYQRCGIEFMRFNTIFQLYALKKWQPELFKKDAKLLFMPDLFGYLLTGNAACEYTIASTSGLVNLKTKQFDTEIINKLGLNQSMFLPVCKTGTELGVLKKEIADELQIHHELNIPQIKVITGAGHDTANAVIASPLPQNDESCYISCGTWSLLGIETSLPYVTEDAFKYNFTNEGGFNGTIRFLKNITGLWLLQESRRQWQREGLSLSFKEIEEAVAKNKSPGVYIDVERGEFASPGDLPALINEYLNSTGQKKLENKIDIAHCILESLALCYDKKIKQLEQITGKKISSVNIIGGGCKDKNLMQFTANAAGKKVIAGPAEATSLGNIIVQLISAEVISSVQEARQEIKGLVTYLPI